ncbi:MAG: hypothetical protein K2G44_00930 [Clostridia bacterium]|nr:hypothetical protein [Clostridia bacterium]
MKSRAYLEEIRGAEGLKRAVLKKIELSGNTATFQLATDLKFSDADVAHAKAVSARFVPAGMNAEVKILKAVPSEEGIRRALLDMLKNGFPAVAAFVLPEDVTVILESGGGHYIIGIGESERGIATDAVLDKLSKELMRSFPGVWYGEFRSVQKDKGEIELDELPPEEIVAAPRYFNIVEFVAIDGGTPSLALYIADLTKEAQDITVCGVISYIEEKLTKNEKPYFSVTISDGTAQLRFAYFSKKATLEKMRGLKSGDSICVTGDNELYNGMLGFRAKQINFGRAPLNFVPQARPSRPVPPKYKTVFPAPASDFVQGRLFEDRSEVEALVGREFVVFDLETTGLNNTPSAGGMDRIIEVGAVKIKNGQIAEKFSSFVACPVRLSSEIVKLTGITDEMLVGAPDIKDIIADFYKFTAGSTLVGHNVQFDYRFIRYYGEKEGYLFEQKQYDTVTFAQEMLRLSNYKLNTVADHFGFSFNHHRAYDDAFVTAKIFLALVKMKNGLPRG